MAKNKLTIKVDADTQEALQQMKELTEAANECVAAFEKLEKVMGRFEKKPVQMINLKPNFNPVIKTPSINSYVDTLFKGTQV